MQMQSNEIRLCPKCGSIDYLEDYPTPGISTCAKCGLIGQSKYRFQPWKKRKFTTRIALIVAKRTKMAIPFLKTTQ
ncbi:MAG: TFIIB-type zinc ribbon-containing protein [Candidatus Bathyarchaeota archaeon]|nr:TFIIB-type zinc ribbon-containing protein [Candidatus Bathyarchaeota archaeon]